MENALNVMHNTRNFAIKDVIDIWSTEVHCPVQNVTRNYFINSTLISYINYKHTLLVDIKQYQIYVTYTKKSNINFETSDTKTCYWLSSFTPNIRISDIGNNDWIILNLQQAGYYRVNYDFENWNKIAVYMRENYNSIHVLNRAQIIDDAFYFLRQGQLNFHLFCNITSFLLEDTDYVVWYPMIKAIEHMTCTWEIQNNGSTGKNTIKFMLYILLEKVRYEDHSADSDFTRFLREEAINWACIFDVPECRERVTSQLEKHLESSVQDKFFKWKEWIYCKGLMTANNSTWYEAS
nr:PREDICTED: aminopeptidase N-like [Linepithema humile]